MITTTDETLAEFEHAAQTFATKELAGRVEANDRHPFAPLFDSTVERAWESGFFSVMLPEAMGGIDAGIGVLCTLLDRISQVDASLAGMMLTTALAQRITLAAGAQLPEASDARHTLIACPAYIDPAREAELPRARLEGAHATLSGELRYLTLGGIAATALVPARVQGEPGYQWFLVALDGSAGARCSEPVVSLGLHACPSVDVTFDAAAATPLGAPGSGATHFSAAAREVRLGAAAIAAGLLKGSLAEALAYARERSQGGRRIVDWSEVRMMLANMAVQARVADLCLTQACAAVAAGAPDADELAAAATLHIQQQACEIVNDGVQLLGGNGYMKDYGQEKRYRDARHVQSLFGAAPLRKLDLARALIERMQ